MTYNKGMIIYENTNFFGHIGEYNESKKEDCPRTFAVWNPGKIMPGTKHMRRYRSQGEIPCTGPFICTLCGAISDMKK